MVDSKPYQTRPVYFALVFIFFLMLAISRHAFAATVVGVTDPSPAMAAGVVSGIDITVQNTDAGVAGFDLELSFSAGVPINVVNGTTIPPELDPMNPDYAYNESAITIFAPLSERAPPVSGVSTLGSDYFSGRGDDGILELLNDFSDSSTLHIAYIYQSPVNVSPISSGRLASVFFYTGSQVPANTSITVSFVASQNPALVTFDGVEIPVDVFSGMTAAIAASTMDAVDDTAVVDEDGSVVIDPLLNDTGNPPLYITSMTQPSHGTVTDNGDGTLTYAPEPDFYGADSFSYIAADSQSGSDSAVVEITVNPANDPPVADAGDDTSAAEQTAVTLDGTGSGDVDDATLTYLWTQVSGPVVALDDPTAVSPVFTAPDIGTQGADIVFSLTVTDSSGASDADTVSVNVTWVNAPPVADAGDDQAVDEKTLVSIDGSASSDPDDGIASYSWSQTAGPVVSLSDASLAKPSFVAPDVGSGGAVLAFSLTVTDGMGLDSSDTVSVTVRWVNDRPVGVDDAASVDEEGQVVIALLANDADPDGQAVSLAGFTQPSHGTVTDNGDETVTYAPEADFDGTDTFTYTISDGTLESEPAQVDVTVNPVNDPPVADAGPDQTVSEQTVTALNGSNSHDVDDTVLTYEWSQVSGTDVQLSNAGIASPSFTTPDVGVAGEALEFMLTVSDASGATDTDTVIVNVTWSNEPPTADAGPDQTVAEGTLVTLDGSDSLDPDDGIASYLWTQTDGPEVALSDETAETPSFTAPDVSMDGAAIGFDLMVTDAGGLKSTDHVIVNVTWSNDPPTADAGPDQTVDEQTIVTLDGSGSSDPDDGIAGYLWTQVSGPGVTLSDPTIVAPGFVSPDVGVSGAVLGFELTVTDAGGLSSTDDVALVVNWVNAAPEAVDDTATADEDDQVVISPLENDSDPDNQDISLAGYTQPPHGTVTDNGDDTFTYVPEPDFYGNDTFTYTVTDGVLESEPARVDITVNPVNDPPVAHDVTVETRNDIPADIHLNAEDPDSDTLTFTLTDPENGSLSGSPQDIVYTADRGFFGTDTFTYQAGDGALLSGIAVVTITVSENFPAATPECISPEDGTVLATTDEVLSVGNYSDPEDDPHVATHWKVWRKDRLDSLVFEKTVTEDDLFSVQVTGLVPGFAYEWTAGFEDAGSGQVSWSSPRTFIIGSVSSRRDRIKKGLAIADYRMISFTKWFPDPPATVVIGFTGAARDYRFGSYDPDIGGYIYYGPDLEIRPGRAYWILLRHGETLLLDGVDVSMDEEVDVPLGYNPANGNGWNMIAPPNDLTYVWSSIQLVKDGAVLDRIGNLSAGNPYLDTHLWYWHSGRYFNDGVVLSPHGGYWVKTRASGLSLRFTPYARYSLGENPTTTLTAGVSRATAMVRHMITPVSATADSGESPPLPMASFDSGGAASGSGGCVISTAGDESGRSARPGWIFAIVLLAAGLCLFIRKSRKAKGGRA